MALFKIYKGLSNNLKNTPNPQKENVTQLTKEGHCYFTTDDGKFYIDIVNNVIPIYPNADGSNFAEVTRMPINAFKADRAAIAEWSARALADVNGNDIHTHYAHSLGIDGYKLKLIAADTTNLVLSEVTLPSDVETAKKFTSDQIIRLTGAVIGEHESQAGWEIATTLANNIVTTTKINNSAVTNVKIADGAVTNGKIANSTISNAKLVNSSININGVSVSLGGSLTLADIGLSSALRFIGQTTTAIVDGGTTSPVSVNGSNVTPTIGDVVINSNNNQEYVWLGSNWELLGDESSYALKDHTHKYAGSSSAGGAANSANKLNTNAGSSTKPVYFKNGIPEQCEDTLAVNINGDADTVDGYHGTDLVKYKDALLTVNPFGGKKLYISRIDNALYAADIRYNVTAKVYDKASGNELRTADCHNLFNGRYDEGGITVTPDEILKVTIDFTQSDWGFFGPYGYGYFYSSFYHTDVPETTSVRVYSNYTGHTVGWYDLSVEDISQGYNGGKIIAARNDFYKVEQIEFTYSSSTNNIRISEIECFLDRGQDVFTTPVINKYEPETLYYALTAPEFKGKLTGNADTATKTNNSLIIKLNGGTTEGTNLFTFNGSAAKSVNITPAAIGASASGHNHTLTPTTATIKQVNSVGTMFAASVEGEVLILTPGSAPTTANVTVYTGLTIAAAT